MSCRLGIRVSAFLLFALLLFLSPAIGRSQVVLSAAVNGASYLQSSLPNGKLAEGVLFIAFGQGMGPASIERAESFPLPTSLAGTSIRVTVGGVTVDCIILYSLSGQVAAILPSNTPVGDGTMVLTYNGVSSAALNITVVARSFGAFAINQGGSGPGVFRDADGLVANGLTTAANPGQEWDIWGTGLGPVTGDEAAGPLPGNMANANVQVFFGAVEAQVVYRGRSGCCAGVDQIRIVVPAVDGCYVPIYVVVDGVVSNFVSMSVAQSGSACSNPGGYNSELFQVIQANGGLRLGSVGISRFFVSTTFTNYQGDAANAGFLKFPLAGLGGGSGPVANSCRVIQFPTGMVPLPENLDAGSRIPMMSPMGTFDLVPPLFGAPFGQYGVAFSPNSAGGPPIEGLITDGTVLQPGRYTFTGLGGADVGSFSVSLDLPPKLDWTNRVAPGAIISRSQALTIRWTNGFPGALIAINGQSQVSPGVGASFTCWAEPAAGFFNVPAAVMSAVPPSYFNTDGDAQGSLNVFQLFLGPSFTATGIDLGTTAFSDGFNVGQIGYR